MAELHQTGNVQTMSKTDRVKSLKKAETSGTRKGGERQPGASTAPKIGEAGTSLPALYQDLLGSRGDLEGELQRRTLALATLAHEIKNPLAIVTGYVEMLLSLKVGPLTKRQQGILEETRTNCTRLQKFAREFLAYSSLTNGNPAVMLRLDSADLSACVSEVSGYWMDKFSAKGVALYFRANPEIPRFHFDYDKVQQVVSNLLENSLKFTAPGGTVWLTADLHVWERRGRKTTACEVERRSGGSTVASVARVTVADTGKGIAPEFYQDVFEDFFRGPGDENQTEGAGLGLAIARRLIQMHEGKIWVESEVGVGSKFCFLLPLRQG